jgi:hypothetical protein
MCQLSGMEMTVFIQLIILRLSSYPHVTGRQVILKRYHKERMQVNGVCSLMLAVLEAA